jgi:hypothetical protein
MGDRIGQYVSSNNRRGSQVAVRPDRNGVYDEMDRARPDAIIRLLNLYLSAKV